MVDDLQAKKLAIAAAFNVPNAAVSFTKVVEDLHYLDVFYLGVDLWVTALQADYLARAEVQEIVTRLEQNTRTKIQIRGWQEEFWLVQL